MRQRLPSLNALRAFEAAARRENITAAAEELIVSPGAVSRQVALLEAHFKCRFFNRLHRGLELTEKGREYYEAVKEAFDRIDDAGSALMGLGDMAPLRVSIYTTFASEWLFPRLSDFREANPSIDLSVEATLRKFSFKADAVDIVVMTGHEERDDLHHERLFSPLYFPVCNPKILTKRRPLAEPADLARHTLLYSRRQIVNWRAWLAAAGVRDFKLDRGLAFENSSLAFKAAREGAGVALGQQIFLTDDLVSGRLVAPFNLTYRSANSYVLTCEKRRMNEPQIKAFRDWFVAAVASAAADSAARLPNLLVNEVTADAAS